MVNFTSYLGSRAAFIYNTLLITNFKNENVYGLYNRFFPALLFACPSIIFTLIKPMIPRLQSVDDSMPEKILLLPVPETNFYQC